MPVPAAVVPPPTGKAQEQVPSAALNLATNPRWLVPPLKLMLPKLAVPVKKPVTRALPLASTATPPLESPPLAPPACTAQRQAPVLAENLATNTSRLPPTELRLGAPMLLPKVVVPVKMPVTSTSPLASLLTPMPLSPLLPPIRTAQTQVPSAALNLAT